MHIYTHQTRYKTKEIKLNLGKKQKNKNKKKTNKKTNRNIKIAGI